MARDPLAQRRFGGTGDGRPDAVFLLYIADEVVAVAHLVMYSHLHIHEVLVPGKDLPRGHGGVVIGGRIVTDTEIADRYWHAVDAVHAPWQADPQSRRRLSNNAAEPTHDRALAGLNLCDA